MSELTVVRPGQSVSEAVKEGIQQSAQAKQLLEVKKQVTGKLNNVINVLMQSFAVDPDNACSTAIAYAAGLAHGSGTSKDDFLKSVDKVWDIQVAYAEEVMDEQRKMILSVARQLMENKQPIPPHFIGQMQALKCVIPDDLQSYIDKTPQTPAEAVAQEVTKVAAAAEEKQVPAEVKN